MKKFLIGVAVLICMACSIHCATDFCKTRCIEGTKNIGCNATGKFGSNCPSNATSYEFNQSERNLLLHLHNDLRNAVCNGSLSGYEPCARSARIVWDNELAYLAGLNTRNCNVIHDRCRNTEKFNAAGQNIGSGGKWGGYLTPVELINKNFGKDGLFIEYKNANMSYINKFRFHDDGLPIGHFTQLMASNATHVGCGATKYYTGGAGYYVITCDYAIGNIIDYPIYVSSKTGGSGCSKGTDSTYKALCSINEPIDPNYLFPFP